MAGRGGARPNSGPKHKWTLNGQPIKTYAIRIPEVVTPDEVMQLVREKLAKLESNNTDLSKDD